MDRARWERVQTLFHRAVELEEPGRRAFLECECGGDVALVAEVLDLAAEDGHGHSILDGDVADLAGRMVGEAPNLESRQIGPYRIKHLLGEGGMGVVYLPERDDLQSQVAIKVLPDAWLSPARRARFVLEQRTLARLNHPSIARIYERGGQHHSSVYAYDDAYRLKSITRGDVTVSYPAYTGFDAPLRCRRRTAWSITDMTRSARCSAF